MASTVFVGDFKLFKRTTIDAQQADKWRTVTLPSRLRSATIALARELGFQKFPLQLPPELIWLNPPKRHLSAPPWVADESGLLLCIHPGTGKLDLLTELTSHLSLPSLGLALTARSLQGCTSVAQLEKRYWTLCAEQVQLWKKSCSGTSRAPFGGKSNWCQPPNANSSWSRAGGHSQLQRQP